MTSAPTIAAVATPVGSGSLAVIRLSGTMAFAIADRIFRTSKNGCLAEKASHTIHYGRITHCGQPIDDAMAAVFRAPHSFTGEDTVEFYCHGSAYIQRNVLAALIDSGAAMAQRGEFTRRAFANGKITLAQAEAIGDLIAADSAASHRMALGQMRGGYWKQIVALRQKLLDLAALIELELDFGEEDVEFASRVQTQSLIDEASDALSRLVSTFSAGNAIKSGYCAALVGKVNAGKSSLLNALLCEDRALVSSAAGTTRDTIEGRLVIEGVGFRLVDTAGLRIARSEAERLGVARAMKTATEAHIILWITDGSRHWRSIERGARTAAAEWGNREGKHLLAVLHKSDLLPPSQTQELLKKLRSIVGENAAVLAASSVSGDGIEEIKRQLAEWASLPTDADPSCVVSNARHYEAMMRTLDALNGAVTLLAKNGGAELIACHIREATAYLGSIAGEIADTDVLNTIFSRFCIGK